MRKFTTVATMLLFVLGLGACNTMKGFGKDMQQGGEKVQQKASDVQNNQ